MRNEWLEAFGLISLISFELVFSTGVGAWLGYFLSIKYQLPKYCILITTLLGFLLGLIWVMRLLKQSEQRKKLDKNE